jgi:hypothetical protein
MQFSLFPCYLVPPRPNYFPQHPILKHPQPTLLLQCQLPSFTPIQNNGQNFLFTFCYFLQSETNMQKATESEKKNTTVSVRVTETYINKMRQTKPCCYHTLHKKHAGNVYKLTDNSRVPIDTRSTWSYWFTLQPPRFMWVTSQQMAHP